MLSNSIFAQSYIKVKEDVEIKGIKILKGEIFLSIPNNKFLFGKDTLEIDKKKYDKIENIDNSVLDSKLDYIKRKDNINYQINVTKFLNRKDTIKFIKSNNNILPFFSKGIDSVRISDCGDVFRIVILNIPSIIFYSNEIPKPVNHKVTPEQNKMPIEKTGLFDNLSWWQYGLGFILLLVVVYVIWVFAKKYFVKKYPLYEKYTGGKLSDLARKHNIELYQLEKYNKDKLKGYSKMDDNERKNLQRSIENTNLKVGYVDDSGGEMKKEKIFEFHKPNPKTDDLSDTNPGIFQQLQSMERRIINKIETLESNIEALQKIESQQKEIELFKERIIQNNKNIAKITNEHDAIQTELINAKKEKQQIETEYARYSDKVIFVDFLEAYARVVGDYFDLAKSGYKKALELYKGIPESDDKNSLIVGQLLLKFQSNLPLKIGNWEEIVKEIMENKATSNLELVRSFMQIQSNEEKLKEFKRILFKEVLEKYSGSILILTEELTKLSKFTGKTTGIIQEYEQYFSNFGNQLHGKLKIIGLDLKFVPLFENYESFAAHTKLTNQDCSPPYKRVKGLEKGVVLEIMSYGFGNEETKVIIA